ncbi:DUF6207 family protein [Streptomyces sp. NBC_01092]|uniref:DUF6207 family protein n=1 Tax=Streptomyces sp. NBC_01092 TaxID=2903748 RepID=UPI003867D81E
MTLNQDPCRCPGRGDSPRPYPDASPATARNAGQPGVRLRMYTDLRQVLDGAAPPAAT